MGDVASERWFFVHLVNCNQGKSYRAEKYRPFSETVDVERTLEVGCVSSIPTGSRQGIVNKWDRQAHG